MTEKNIKDIRGLASKDPKIKNPSVLYREYIKQFFNGRYDVMHKATFERNIKNNDELNQFLNHVFLENKMRGSVKADAYLEGIIDLVQNQESPPIEMVNAAIVASTRLSDQGLKAVTTRIGMDTMRQELEALRIKVRDLEKENTALKREDGAILGGVIMDYGGGKDFETLMMEQQNRLKEEMKR